MISAVMPVRNAVPHVRRALDSLLAQTDPLDEILLVDDHSTDATRATVHAWASDRVRILPNVGAGIAEAMNTGVTAARGTWLLWQDADDWSHPDRVRRLRAHVAQHAEVDVVASAAVFVGADSQPIDTPWTRYWRRAHDSVQSSRAIRRVLPLMCCLLPPTMLCRRETWLAVGGCDPAFTTPAYDLLLRLLTQGCVFAQLGERLYTYRLHADQTTARDPNGHLADLIHAKTRYLRRVAPNARTVRLAGASVEVPRYEAACRRVGWTVLTPSIDPAVPHIPDADVVIVVDLRWLPRWESVLTAHHQEGNAFLR